MAKRRRSHSPLSALMRWLLVLAALALFVYWGNTDIKTDAVTYTSSALPAAFDGLRIVQLSDLHNREFGQNNAELYKAVENASPDVIFLTGDLVDEYAAEPVPYARSVGAALSAIAPTYYVTGNHEWAHGNAVVEEIKAALREAGVTVLSNEFVPLERDGDAILIAGIDDPNGYADQKTPDGLAEEIYSAYDDPFWLLLAHRNNLFNGRYCRLGADLTFSGHAHGGIWRLPFTDGLVDTNLHFLPSFTSGFYRCTDEDCEGAEVFVSRGLGNSPRWAFRLFNRPQVAVITLKKDNAMETFSAGQFDIAVIGAGHAGIEAALAAARWGWKPLYSPSIWTPWAICPAIPPSAARGKAIWCGSWTRWAAKWPRPPTNAASSTAC